MTTAALVAFAAISAAADLPVGVDNLLDVSRATVDRIEMLIDAGGEEEGRRSGEVRRIEARLVEISAELAQLDARELTVFAGGTDERLEIEAWQDDRSRLERERDLLDAALKLVVE